MRAKPIRFWLYCGGLVLWIGGNAACTPSPRRSESSDLVTTHLTQLRREPRENGSVLRELAAGTELVDLGGVSPYLTGIYLGDTLCWEPWLRVRTLEGHTGWVFGATVQPVALSDTALDHWVHRKRLQALLGVERAAQLLRWAGQEISTDTALADHLRQGLALREALQTALSQAFADGASKPRPDWRWLKEYLRYFRWYREGLALDYGRLAHLARGTQGGQDDTYLQLCLQAYPIDSMESPLPVWVFPLGWTQSASNLGAGRHLALLRAIDSAFQQAPLFDSELEHLKRLLLDDILDADRAYWQPLPRILAELDQLLAEPPSCLQEHERSALRLRRAMLAQVQARTDMRSGR